MKIYLGRPFKKGAEEMTELEATHVIWEEGHTALKLTIEEHDYILPLSNVLQIDLQPRETIGPPRGLAHREYR
jgi:hypothetical protein